MTRVAMHSGPPLVFECWDDTSTHGGFVLSRWGDFAGVEGDSREWGAIAEGLAQREPRDFRRCALRFDGDGAVLWSPRGTPGVNDCIRVPLVDVLRLRACIVEVLAGWRPQVGEVLDAPSASTCVAPPPTTCNAGSHVGLASCDPSTS